MLENSPIDRALDLIFKQRAGGPVRRVLAFVVPDPSAAPETVAQDPTTPPGLLNLAFDTMVRIPRVQSVSSQIEELRQHNERVRQRRRDRVLLTRTIDPSDLQHAASVLFETYRAQRVQNAVRHIVDRIDQGLAAMEADGLGRRGRRAWLVSVLTDLGPSLPFVPSEAPGSAERPEEREPHTWRWGTLPVQHMARVFLDLVARTQRVANYSSAPPDLLLHWRAAFEAIEDIERVRAFDRGRWPELAPELQRLLGGPSDARGTAEAREWLANAVRRWQTEPPATALGSGKTPPAGEVAHRIASGIQALLVSSSRLLDGSEKATDEVVQREIQDLVGLAAYFHRSPDDTAYDVLDRLLELEILQEATGPTSVDVEQEIDYVQISADKATSFGGPERVAERLTGLQLAHFGAFYKGSWRANDWMWGRLDAVDRLVLLLLEPSRILAIARKWPEGQRAKRLTDEIKIIALGPEATKAYAVLQKEFSEDKLVEELSFLDDPDRLMPERLVETATVLVRRLQLEILLQELPHVAEQVRLDLFKERGSDEIRRLLVKIDEARRGGSLDPAEVRVIMNAYCVGSQRLVDEIGTDRMSVTAAQAVAVSVAALRREVGPFRMIGSVLAALRLPTLAVYVLARNSATGSRTATGLNVAALVAGFVVVATHFLTGKHVYPWWVVAMGALALVAGIGWTLARERASAGWIVGGFGVACLLGSGLFATDVLASPTVGIDAGRAAVTIVLVIIGGLLLWFASRMKLRR